MIIRKCDRCGKIIDTANPSNYMLPINMAIFTLETGPFVRRIDQETKARGFTSMGRQISGDLCTECTKEFYVWLDKGEFKCRKEHLLNLKEEQNE